MNANKKVYLGDGLYAEREGDMIKLSAPREGGMHVVYLEWEVFAALVRFAEVAWGLRITVNSRSE